MHIKKVIRTRDEVIKNAPDRGKKRLLSEREDQTNDSGDELDRSSDDDQ